MANLGNTMISSSTHSAVAGSAGAKTDEQENASLTQSPGISGFSAKLGEVVTAPRDELSKRRNDSTALLEIEIPETYGHEAYELIPADGNGLPPVGKGLPALSVGLNLASEQLTLSHEAKETSVDAATALQEDITAWLQDPELSFFSDEGLNSSLSNVMQRPSDVSTMAAESAANHSASAAVKPGPQSTQGDGKTDEFLLASGDGASEKAAALNQSAQADAKQVGIDLGKQPATQGPIQFFDQLKLEKQQSTEGRLRNFKLSAFESNLEVRNPVANGPGHSSLSSLTPNSLTTNSVSETTGPVLALADGGQQTSQGVAVAIEQWKSQQSSLPITGSEMEHIPKAGFARATIPFGQASWSENIGRQLSMMMARNMDSAQIQIDPPELGLLQVKIQVNNDQVSLQFNAAHGAVREALEASSVKLHSMFAEEGMELMDFQVGGGGPQDRGSENRDNSSQSGSRTAEQSNTVSPTNSDVNLTLIEQGTVDDGKIDYFI